MSLQLSDLIDKFGQIQQRLTLALPPVQRPLLANWDLTTSRASLLLGPRGVGKTNFLLHEARRHGAVAYFSADHPLLGQANLWEIAEALFLQGAAGLAMDEVHYMANWSQHLKAIYDSFPDKKIWASDSSSAVLRAESGDLSRRFLRRDVPYMAFREYLALKHGQDLPAFDAFSAKLPAFAAALSATNILAAFKTYQQEGFRPLFLEGDFAARMIAILDKIIHTDIPYFLPSLQDSHLRVMRAVVAHLAQAPVPTINVEAMASTWGVGKEKLYDLLTVMEHVGLLAIIRYPNDRNQMGKGAKIFFADPNLYAVLDGDKGSQREALVVAMLRLGGRQVYACKDETAGDFIVGDRVIEVGGLKKKPKKAEYVIRDDLDLPSKRALPLWSLGMAP